MMSTGLREKRAMKINYFSDVHLEWQDCQLPDNDADIVIAAGDIGYPYEASEWLKRIEKPVLYIAGNHEYYGGEFGNRMEKLEKHCRDSNITFLDNGTFEYQGFKFFGATMWTDFDLYRRQDFDMFNAPNVMNDYSQIRLRGSSLAPAYILRKHTESRARLEHFIDTADTSNLVIITHHLPSSLSIDEKYRAHSANPYYATELDSLFREGMHWFHGHTHSTCEYELFGCEVHANPRGYATKNRTENGEFDINKILSV